MFIVIGIAAAIMFKPEIETQLSETQLRVAFDGDAVLFSDESEIIVKQHGLDTFFEHEKLNENTPLAKVCQVFGLGMDHMTVVLLYMPSTHCASEIATLRNKVELHLFSHQRFSYCCRINILILLHTLGH